MSSRIIDGKQVAAELIERIRAGVEKRLINGKRAPIRGRVCMDLIMVDVTNIKGVKLGSEITLIGRDGSERITASDLAEWSGTIHYEILARLSPAARRVLTD